MALTRTFASNHFPRPLGRCKPPARRLHSTTARHVYSTTCQETPSSLPCLPPLRAASNDARSSGDRFCLALSMYSIQSRPPCLPWHLRRAFVARRDESGSAVGRLHYHPMRDTPQCTVTVCIGVPHWVVPHWVVCIAHPNAERLRQPFARLRQPFARHCSALSAACGKRSIGYSPPDVPCGSRPHVWPRRMQARMCRQECAATSRPPPAPPRTPLASMYNAFCVPCRA